MHRPHRIHTALAVFALGTLLATPACNKKAADKSGGGGGGTMGAMGEDDPAQPDPRPVEMAADMAPDMAPDMRAPADRDPDDGMIAGTDPTIPKEGQAAARMILIPWKDAENLVEEISRSKADAKALAKKVLDQAKAKPTEKNFAKLAKKHSMGPTKENGGKVGPFGPKDVPAYIAKAVFPLKKGGISGIVETKSGFHIFMRTE
jgi:hypothetical protein